MKNISYSHANKIRKDFAPTLVLKVRVFVTVGKERKVGQQRKAYPGLPLGFVGYKSRPQGPVVFHHGRHIGKGGNEKRESPDVAHMYHGGRGRINIEGGRRQ